MMPTRAAFLALLLFFVPAESHATESITYPGSDPSSVLILTSGSMDAADKFEKLGKISKLREIGYNGTIISVAYNTWDYMGGFTLSHLRKTYVLPNLEEGRTVDLLGVSAGGAVSALYAMRFPDEVRHVISLSPSIAFNHLFTCARMSWQPFICSFSPGNDKLENLVVGYGKGDRYLKAQELLAAQATNTFTVTGDHTWVSFDPLFDLAIASFEVTAAGTPGGATDSVVQPF